ncbi:MAG: hypothetical protein JWN53_719, partial [Gemmatimonadetes bacterium]|nr:hypothetical protein [Gemmatimonadota bacterium]
AWRSEEHTHLIIQAARSVASSGDRSEVLVGLARAKALRTQALRDEYLRAAAEIPASGDMRRVLEAATRP